MVSSIGLSPRPCKSSEQRQDLGRLKQFQIRQVKTWFKNYLSYLNFGEIVKIDNSIYNGDGKRQKGACIFFSDKFWTEDECLYKSDNGDLVIAKLVGKNLSVIVSNVYAPNDHNEEYFDHLKDIMLDIQIVHPTIPVIMLGDFVGRLQHSIRRQRYHKQECKR